MTKKTMENETFKDRIKSLDCVLETKVTRNEIEVKLYCENPDWGMPNEFEQIISDETMGEKFAIIDFSHIQELENGGCHITVYVQNL